MHRYRERKGFRQLRRNKAGARVAAATRLQRSMLSSPTEAGESDRLASPGQREAGVLLAATARRITAATA